MLSRTDYSSVTLQQRHLDLIIMAGSVLSSLSHEYPRALKQRVVSRVEAKYYKSWESSVQWY